MKKRVLAMALAAALLLALAACGGQTNDNPGGTQTPSGGTQTQQPAQTQTPAETQTPTETQDPAGTETPAAPAATNRPVEEMSEEERMVLNAVCTYLQRVAGSTGLDPAIIAEMKAEFTSEAFIRSICAEVLQWRMEEAGVEAAAELMLDRAGEIIELAADMGIDNLMYTINMEPQNVPVPGGWDAFYREYETVKARVEAAIAVIDTAAEAFPAIELADSAVLYRANGVELTFTGCTVSGNTIYFNFHVSNQNPDNKKVSVLFSLISVNSLRLNDPSSLSFATHRGVGNLAVGEEADISCPCAATADYELMLSRLGETVETMPIETLDFAYSLQIGSNSEAEEMTAGLRTTLYREGDVEALLGTYVESISYNGQNIDIYAKHGDFGIAAVAVNTGVKDCSDFLYANVNGRRVGNLNRITHTVGMLMGTTSVSPNGAEIVFYTDMTDGDLRKEYEIGSSELLEISLDYCGANVVVYSK